MLLGNHEKVNSKTQKKNIL